MRTIRDEDDDGADVVELEATCLHVTERAIRVRLASGSVHWIPKACVHDNSEVYEKGDEGKLVVLAKFAEREGLVD